MVRGSKDPPGIAVMEGGVAAKPARIKFGADQVWRGSSLARIKFGADQVWRGPTGFLADDHAVQMAA